MYTIEFQKRGLPYAYILIILLRDNKPRETIYVDKITSTEIPDPVIDPLLYSVVVSNIIYRKYSEYNPKAIYI